MFKVKVYSSPACYNCVQVKNYLKAREIVFEECSITKQEHKDYLKANGFYSVPVLVGQDDHKIVGFDVSLMDTYFAQHKEELND